VYALPGLLRPSEYRVAMSLGMRRSGTLVYRPVCKGCRRCQPFRIAVERFEPSRSQRRVQKRCDGLFDVELTRPIVDDEHLRLYRRYQEDQHDKDGQDTDEESYARFLIDTVVDTWELSWRDKRGDLVAVGIVDVVDDGVSTVYFYWDPSLRDLSLGVYSALWEIDLTRRWGKAYYYLGYLVGGAVTMSYKSQFSGGEIWDGEQWLPVPSRDLSDPAMQATMQAAEAGATQADDVNFATDEPSRG
jgi:arginine-tRNA-protein transferase